MEQNTILFPIFALVFLTFGIGIWLGFMRFASVRRGDLSPKYFKLNRGGKLPEYLAKVNNNYDNLYALPILFYVVSILLLVTAKVETTQLVLAWGFVASRYVHSYIHTTSNRLMHRMRIFFFGTVILIAMWVLFFIRIVLAPGI